jgi:hypothetical protein
MDAWLVLLVLVLILVVWFTARPPAIFVVRIKFGQPHVSRRKVTPAFLAEIGELCRQHDVEGGEVRGVVRGRRIALWFSGRVPPSFRQQLRNWWVMSGWATRPGRA